MKKNIHPKWYPKAKVKCSCGNQFTTGATIPRFDVEVCSNCHSFYTGNQKLVDTAGRLTRYQERMAKAQNFKTKKKKVTAKAERKSGNKKN